MTSKRIRDDDSKEEEEGEEIIEYIEPIPRGPESLVKMLELAKSTGHYKYLPEIGSMDESGNAYFIRNKAVEMIGGSKDNVTENPHILVISIFFDNYSQILENSWQIVSLRKKMIFKSEGRNICPIVVKKHNPMNVIDNNNTEKNDMPSSSSDETKNILIDMTPLTDRVYIDHYTSAFLGDLVNDMEFVMDKVEGFHIIAIIIQKFPIEDQTKRWNVLANVKVDTTRIEEDKKMFLETRARYLEFEKQKLAIENTKIDKMDQE